MGRSGVFVYSRQLKKYKLEAPKEQAAAEQLACTGVDSEGKRSCCRVCLLLPGQLISDSHWRRCWKPWLHIMAGTGHMYFHVTRKTAAYRNFMSGKRGDAISFKDSSLYLQPGNPNVREWADLRQLQYVSDVEAWKKRRTLYKNLKDLDIPSCFMTELEEGKRLVGCMGVDNPTKIQSTRPSSPPCATLWPTN
ncbi:MAG: hypothetical protein ACLRMZ_09140 [Blautia marasmi]